ncbi:hypothetical protein COX69_04340 [Candidatus Falkowbacteria bacterium CG_4_10_14_0_2_um_filter_48_10]|uniref:Uncharacterized protein n=1 Tax=Candidatus Falkowbacteria bacterium CG23_combo_of_CG06-09_8_20_14_all_49_15 TaxID=1974572 RepID=A0A2G9ZM38_9BACT|nr:MAG: hypothetical protein COX22_00195 [Candidatus Falkowbacteria bacterium CG23_combo_of_CG06-09_8_20_14_all_49_15]PJA07561.1 MAG: hypothetical protein COX69_04340 [Candidatus Falkowbacteria bacterium CG_4_10_14_0_2_um_filter_48_10]
MSANQGLTGIKDILAKKSGSKPPTHIWQEFALRVISELRIPAFKRNAVFLVCKTNSRHFLEQCLNDTKELCQQGEAWKYFFKLAAKKNQTWPKSKLTHK